MIAICCTGAAAITVQQGGLRMSVFAQVKPYKLPRSRPAPIAIFVAGHLESADRTLPPQVEGMRVEVNRHGLLRTNGLPSCGVAKIADASSSRALKSCSDALVGSGQFWAHIVLPEQGSYPTRGELLVFNGRWRGQPALLAHVYTSNPFNSAFTIPFAIRKISKGPYGTELSASFPTALGEWGYLDRIKLTLRREYTVHGRRFSYFNAACPAPQHVSATAFPLAKVSLSVHHKVIAGEIVKSCEI